MYNFFAPYEQDFLEWWQSRAYPDVNPLTRDFLTHLTRPDAPRRLWRFPEEAVMRMSEARNELRRRHKVSAQFTRDWLLVSGGRSSIASSHLRHRRRHHPPGC